jgi:hypothetical protein
MYAIWKGELMGTDGRIPVKDWRWVLTWAGVILALSCLPYLIAWVATPSGYQFGGILVNPFDGNSYLAKMRQGWAGLWQFHLTYTPESHDGAYIIYLFYLGLGHVARLTGLPLVLIYHAARVLTGLALLVAVYVFLVRLTHSPRERRLGFWLVGISSGLGWLGLAVGAFPIDLWVPEAFAFFSLLSNPHFPLAMALMLIMLMGVVWPVSGVRRWLVPGLAALALVFVHPLGLIPVYVTLACYLVLRTWLDRKWPSAELAAVMGVGLLSVPVLLYGYWIYTTNPAMSAWAEQNVTPAPRIFDLVLGFGLVGLLAILGGVVAVRDRDPGGLALLTWSIVALVLVYVPFALQRRFLTGLGLPLAILAAMGLSRWLSPKLSNRRVPLVGVVAVGVSALGSLFLLMVLILGVLNRQGQPDLFARLYLSQDESAAMEWLLTNARDEIVIAAPRTGMWLPGRSGVRVFAGHPFETIDVEVKDAQAEAFFRGEMPKDEWQRLKEAYRIRYVFVGPAEQALGGGGDYLREVAPIYHQGEVSIYYLP